MPEGMNVEIAEVAVLAIVAIATAWSGYQAARWDGQQSLLYGQATAARFRAAAASTHGGQGLSADASMFTAYLQAHSAGDIKLEASYVRRFTPDYKTAFVVLYASVLFLIAIAQRFNVRLCAWQPPRSP